MAQSIEESSSLILHPSSIDAGKRLDAFLAEKVEGWSRSRLQRLIEDDDVLVNQKHVRSSYKLRTGDEIDVELTEAPPAPFEPENIPLDIVFEDEYLAVINKAAGMIVHPGAGVTSGTLANAIAWHFRAAGPDKSVPPALAGGGAPQMRSTSEQFESRPPAHAGGTDTRSTASDYRVGIVHRLDKDTSGLIVVAKNEVVHEALGEQFRNREVHKSYVALVHGSPGENTGTIDRPIARDRWHRTKMTVAANGRSALSLWKVRQRFEKFTLLDVEIKTGRTHQIRVHLASLNHPVVGDDTYNEGRDNTINDINVRNAIRSMNRFFLHAQKLSFTHPVTSEQMEFVLPLPDELKRFLDIIEE